MGLRKKKVDVPGRKASSRPEVPGRRVGTKRRDMRWLAPDGTEWDSKLEYAVYLAYQQARKNVRRAGEEDRLFYTSAVRNGACTQCDSCEVVQRHSYLPDFHVGPEDDRERGGLQAPGHLVEVKGYLRAEQRSLLRSLRKARPDVDLRFIFERDYKVTAKLSVVEWARKYLHVRAVVWDGSVPDWEGK